MDYAKARCPKCRRSQWLALGDAGQIVVCPACGQRYTLDLPPGTPTSSRRSSAPPPAELQQPEKPLPPELIRAFYIGGGILGFLVLISMIYAFTRGHGAPPPAPAPAPVLTPAPVVPAPTPVVVAEAPAHRPTTRANPTSAIAIKSFDAATQPSAGDLRPKRIVAVRPPRSTVLDGAELDEKIGTAINRGCDFLLSSFKDGILPEASTGEGEPAGRDALAVYALLQASKASSRPDLSVDSPVVAKMLNALLTMPMSINPVTYDRSLRIQALSVYGRPSDRKVLNTDANYLAKAGRAGGYGYVPPIHTGTLAVVNAAYLAEEQSGQWDNSNSQYGALGVWAAEDAGVSVPSQYWGAVRKHWLQCQRPNGQWGYAGMTGTDGRLSMTVAGLTMMFVAEDHLGVGSTVEEAGHPAYSAAVARGLDWLSEGDNAVTLPGDWPAYTLYGLERAGLASGIKTFGKHDWYRELAAKQVLAQGTDGSWGNIVDTAFNLLFLSRGRHPLLFDKLQYDGAWANRPRDVANLTQFASKQLERPFNWQVVPLSAGWTNWMDAPVLYMASHTPPPFRPADIDQLRLYAENGGLIFTAADLNSAAYNTFVADLAAKLFPQYPFRELPPDHPIYRSLFPLTRAGATLPKLQGVSNGSRLLLIHSPTDMGRAWQLHTGGARPAPFQLGMNIFIYAAGKADYHNRLVTTYVTPPDVAPIATTNVARVMYDGDWKPEPAAAERFSRLFLKDTSIRVAVTDVSVDHLDARATPVALLTGTADIRLTPDQLKSLRAFVTAGGILVADACGSAPDARKALLEKVLPTAFDKPPTDLPDDHPIVAGTFPGMTPFDAKLRRFAGEQGAGNTAKAQGLLVGDGVVVFSPYDITTGLLGTQSWGVNGYRPEAAYDLVRNAVLYAVEREPIFGR